MSDMKKELGKLFLDLAKIIFATAFLGAIISDSINKVVVGIVSATLVVGFIVLGLGILKKSEE
jgi:hypothetical protein